MNVTESLGKLDLDKTTLAKVRADVETRVPYTSPDEWVH
jgi:hypothetical protein